MAVTVGLIVALSSTDGEGEGQEPVVVPDDQGVADIEQAARPDAERQERDTAVQRFPDPQVAVGPAGGHYGDAIARPWQHGDPDDLALCRVCRQRVAEPYAEGLPH